MERTPRFPVSCFSKRLYRSWGFFVVLTAFLANSFGPLPLAQAQEFRLPAPGVMVRLSPEFNPPILKGLKVHPNNPFRFDFILDKGDSSVPLKPEATKLIKYFLSSLTIPEKDLWVNLSPYEKNRIIPQSFGLTEMGRDLLAEDYMLKQITASLIYPEDEIGKKFWKRIYEEAAKKFGTTNIPVNTFNKVWIVPEKAVVYENSKAGTAYVVEAKLKVMLEEDYLSLSHHVIPAKGRIDRHSQLLAGIQNTSALGSQIVREIVIPELTKEINQNKNFAQLRQVYNSLILATWYKKKIKDSILAQVYEDKKKVAGVGYKNSINIEAIYQRYLQAFKKGAYNYIKEEQDPLTQQVIPRKYFSGGAAFNNKAMLVAMKFTTQMPKSQTGLQEIDINLAMAHQEGFIRTRHDHPSWENQAQQFHDLYGESHAKEAYLLYGTNYDIRQGDVRILASILNAHHIFPKPGGTLVVAGFGSRLSELPMLQKLFQASRVLGVDWMQSVIDRADIYLRQQDVSPDVFGLYHEDVRDMHSFIKDDSVDVFFAQLITEHDYSRESEKLNEILRILKPGGVAFLGGCGADFAKDIPPGLEVKVINSGRSIILYKAGKRGAESQAMSAPVPAQNKVAKSPQARKAQAKPGDKAMVELIDKRLKRAAEAEQVAVLNYHPDIPGTREALIAMLGFLGQSYYEVTKENLATTLKRGDGRWLNVVVAPDDLPFASDEQREAFLNLIHVQAGKEVSLETIGDVSRYQDKDLTVFSRKLRDNLTDLYSIEGFRFMVRKLIQKRGDKRDDAHLKLAVFDIDHLGSINSIWGHDQGNKVVVGTSGVFESVVRPDEIIAHLHGGDEFAILTEGSEDRPQQILKAIREKMHQFLPYTREKVIEQLKSKRLENDKDDAYDGMIYQLALQNPQKGKNPAVIESVLKRKFKSLKQIVVELEQPESPYKFEGPRLTYSMGVVDFDENETTKLPRDRVGIRKLVDSLYAQADEHLLVAKSKGRDRVWEEPYRDSAMVMNSSQASDRAMAQEHEATAQELGWFFMNHDLFLTFPVFSNHAKTNKVKRGIYLPHDEVKKLLGIVKKSSLSKYEGSGTVLDANNRNIWEEISVPANKEEGIAPSADEIEVRLKPDIIITESDFRGMVKNGGDFDHIAAIVKQVQDRKLKAVTRGPGMVDFFWKPGQEYKWTMITKEPVDQVSVVPSGEYDQINFEDFVTVGDKKNYKIWVEGGSVMFQVYNKDGSVPLKNIVKAKVMKLKSAEGTFFDINDKESVWEQGDSPEEMHLKPHFFIDAKLKDESRKLARMPGKEHYDSLEDAARKILKGNDVIEFLKILKEAQEEMEVKRLPWQGFYVEEKAFRFHVQEREKGKYTLYFRSLKASPTLRWKAVPVDPLILGAFQNAGDKKKSFGFVDTIKGLAVLMAGDAPGLRDGFQVLTEELSNKEAREIANDTQEGLRFFLQKSVIKAWGAIIEHTMNRNYVYDSAKHHPDIMAAAYGKDEKGHPIIIVVYTGAGNLYELRHKTHSHSEVLTLLNIQENRLGIKVSLVKDLREGDSVIMMSGRGELEEGVAFHDDDDDTPEGIAQTYLPSDIRQIKKNPGILVFRIVNAAMSSANILAGRNIKTRPSARVGLKGQVRRQLKNGGIDLTPARMDLQTKVVDSRFRGNDKGIQFHLDPAMLAQLQNAPGFVPVIINIQPLNDLKAFLAG